MKDKLVVIYLMVKEFIGSKINHTTKVNSKMGAFMEKENWLIHLMKLLSLASSNKVRQMGGVKYSIVMDVFFKDN